MIMVPSTDMQITTIGEMTLTDETHLTPEIMFSAIPRQSTSLLCKWIVFIKGKKD